MMCVGAYFREHVCHFLLDELVGGKRSTKLLSGEKRNRRRRGERSEGERGLGASASSPLQLGVYGVSVHLSSVYCLAVSRQNSAAPRAPHAIP